MIRHATLWLSDSAVGGVSWYKLGELGKLGGLADARLAGGCGAAVVGLGMKKRHQEMMPLTTFK